MLPIFLCLALAFSSIHAADFEAPGLSKTNEYRASHQAPAAALDATLNANAQKCAVYYAAKGTIDHTCTSKDGAGENLFMSMWSGGTAPTCAQLCPQATTSWYNEVSKYDFVKPTGFSSATGHFTQLVWKASTQIGYGCVIQSNKAFVVALYKAAGNMMSGGSDPNVYFKQNVLPKK